MKGEVIKVEIETAVLKGTKIRKAFKGFQLEIDELNIPKGFATALIGENGAGKTTLLNLMTGIRMDYKGEFTYFDEKLGIDAKGVKEAIGYTGPTNYFMSGWNIKQVVEANEFLFDNFDTKRFYEISDALCIPLDNVKSVKHLSDGNKMKLMLACVLARDTKLLILDEPASPLDPLMRDRLCDIIRQYISCGDGERSVFFSTHDIADMEAVTDYAVIMHKGSVLEQGFVEDLKEKYILVKGDASEFAKVSGKLIGATSSRYGFNGLCRAEDLEVVSGLHTVCETPSLHQICIGLMRQTSNLKLF